MLRNVSLHLPENYELVAGTKWENIHLYYDLVKVAMLGNSHNIQMIMRIPFRTANQNFTLHKLIVLPTRKSKDKFIKFYPDFSYFGLSFSQRDYILLKATDLQQCTRGSLVVCPANVALYDAQSLICEGRLFFQTTGDNNL